MRQKALVDCFNDVAVKNPNLHLFLVKECGHLLDLEESTPSHIPVDILTLSGLIDLGPNYSVFILFLKSNLISGLLCYIDGKLLYIGLNTDYVTRIKNHYSKSKDLNRTFYTYVKEIGGFQQSQWTALLPFDSLAIKYQQEGNKLSGY